MRPGSDRGLRAALAIFFSKITGADADVGGLVPVTFGDLLPGACEMPVGQSLTKQIEKFKIGVLSAERTSGAVEGHSGISVNSFQDGHESFSFHCT